MDSVNTLSDDKYKTQLFGLVLSLLNPSDKFSTRDVEIAFRVYNDKITHNLDINDPIIYGIGDNREVPKKAFDKAIKILLTAHLFVKKRDSNGKVIFILNPDGSGLANEWLVQRTDTMVKDLQKIFKDPDKIKHFELDKTAYTNRQHSIIEAQARNPRNKKPTGSSSKSQ